MYDHHQLAKLLHAYFAGELTEEQRRELVALLDREDATEELNSLIQRQLESGELIPDAGLAHTEERIVAGVLEKIRGVPVRRIGRYRRLGWAAAVILVLGGGWFWYARNNVHAPVVAEQKPVSYDAAPGNDKAVLTLADGRKITLGSTAGGAIAQQGKTTIVQRASGRIAYQPDGHETGAVMLNTLQTPRGGQFRLTLPDGTQVWLNAASSITYPTAFTGKERRVTISGEAYFEVAKNNEKPFIADIDGRSSVIVLGTHFDASSYPGEPVKATLLEGRVKVALPGDEALLRPGQQAQVSGQGLSVNKADTAKVMAWKNGYFNFEDMSLAQAMRQLERWYDIQVVYEKGVPDITFEGEISRNIQLSDLLKVLARADVKFRIEKDHRLVVLP